MKYLITESQFNVLLETNKKIEFFQDLINAKLKEIVDGCSHDRIDDWEFSYDTCVEVDMIDSILLTNVSFSEGVFDLDIDVIYTSARDYGFYQLIDDIEYMIKQQSHIDVEFHITPKNTVIEKDW